LRYTAYTLISGLLFAVVAMAHAARLLLGWNITVDGVAVPMWVSWAGLAVPALLALWAFALYRRAD
jgi:hypothetical protein